MTNAVVNNLNNIEEILSVSSKTQKEFGVEPESMDKSSDFNKILNKSLDKTSEKQEITFGSVDVKNSLRDLKNNKDTESIGENWQEFKTILEQITKEANVETSLDLTLARDINEIISQLKEAVENATESLNEEEQKDFILQDVVAKEDSDSESDVVDVLLSEEGLEEDKKEKIFEQVLTFVDKSLAPKDDCNFSEKAEETKSILKESVDITQSEIVEFSEDIVDEVVVSKAMKTLSDVSNVKDSVQDDADISIDEEVLKELKIESISAETNFTGGESYMQNQTPEEHAIKALINEGVDSFEFKVDSTQSSQNMQQAQSKTLDVNPSRIIDQISKHLESLQNNSKVNIVLNPESLGKVNIQLLNVKQGLTAQFIVTTHEAQDLLTKGLDGLKEALMSHGVNVDNVSVKLVETQKTEYNKDWTEQEGSRGGNKGQEQSNKEEKEKGLFEKMMKQTNEKENGNV